MNKLTKRPVWGGILLALVGCQASTPTPGTPAPRTSVSVTVPVPYSGDCPTSPNAVRSSNCSAKNGPEGPGIVCVVEGDTIVWEKDPHAPTGKDFNLNFHGKQRMCDTSSPGNGNKKCKSKGNHHPDPDGYIYKYDIEDASATTTCQVVDPFIIILK